MTLERFTNMIETYSQELDEQIRRYKAMCKCETCRDQDWCSSEEMDRNECPVRSEGEWLSIANCHNGINPGRKCSLCGCIVEFSEDTCPNCRAVMRKEANNA